MLATLQDAGLESEAPDDLLAWIADEQCRVVLLTLLSAADWALLAELHATREDLLVVAAIPDAGTSTYVRALTAGAVGVVPRDAHPTVVRESVRATIQGNVILPIDVLRALAAPDKVAENLDISPSPQEIDWLQQLADGLTVNQLASRVGYSERMMFRLLRDLYNRLRVKGRTDALMLARDKGWTYSNGG